MLTTSSRWKRTWFAILVVYGLFSSVLVSPIEATAQENQLLSGDTRPSTLEEIVVTATPTPTSQDELGNALTIIDEDEMRKQEENFAAESLRNVPNVHVQRSGSPGGSRTRLRLRGAKSKHTVLMIDGVEAPRERFGRTNSGYNLANLTTDDIKRIEVIRGPQSVLYGRSAMAGVINVITKEGSEEPGVEASVTQGSFGTEKLQTGVDGPVMGGTFRLDGSTFESDGFTAAAERFGNTEDDGSHIDTLSGGFQATVSPRLTLGVDLRLKDNDFEFDEQNDPSGHPVDSDQYGESIERFGKLELNYESVNRTWEHSLTRSFANKDRDVYLVGLPSYILQDYEKPSWRYELNYRLEEIGTFTLGASTEDDEIIKETTFGTDRQIVQTDSVFGMYQFQPQRDLHLTLGLRHDWWERQGVLPNRTGQETTYQANGAYYLEPDGTKLRVSVGSAVNLPTFNQWVGTGGFPPGDPDLDPEQSVSGEVGIDLPFDDGENLLQLTYFHRTINDFIRFPPNSLTEPPRQFDEFRTHGPEFTLEQSLTPRLSMTATGALLFSDISGGSEPLQVPDETASLAFDYSPYEEWNSRLSLRYSGQKTDYTTESTPALRRKVQLDDYFVVNATGQIPLSAEQNYSLGIRLENLLDQQYENEYGFETPDRSVYVSLRSTF
jgi:vitamin B12 transporter